MVRIHDILDDYDRLARGLPIDDGTTYLDKLFQFESNLTRPIHRWYKFKEGFSADLVTHLLNEYFRPISTNLSLLDPFCGVGTSLLAVEELGLSFNLRQITLRGVEVNPYIHFVASTKLNWDRYNPVAMLRAAEKATNGMVLRQKPIRPTLSTMRNARFISATSLGRLVELRDKIRVASKGRPELRPLLLGFAAVAEDFFNLRKDGRALRYVQKETAVSLERALDDRWRDMIEDLQIARPRLQVDFKVDKGDGRRADRLYRDRQFHIVLFSPPYLNNIDYTEVYKIESWLLGFLQSREEMLSQRRRTFRSHPSCRFPQTKDAATGEVERILGAPF
ncbi:MAG TPA: hypothetical protein VFM39_06805, partial [bacterium]|nr:hypothetical protein [bacterium]